MWRTNNSVVGEHLSIQRQVPSPSPKRTHVSPQAGRVYLFPRRIGTDLFYNMKRSPSKRLIESSRDADFSQAFSLLFTHPGITCREGVTRIQFCAPRLLCDDIRIRRWFRRQYAQCEGSLDRSATGEWLRRTPAAFVRLHPIGILQRARGIRQPFCGASLNPLLDSRTWIVARARTGQSHTESTGPARLMGRALAG